MLAGLRAEGTEATLVLWALTKAVRDIWNAHTGAANRAPGLAAPAAALAQAQRRAPAPAVPGSSGARRADRMIKGARAAMPGTMTLLAAELCAPGRVPLAVAG
jgi:hypothetical protein